MKKLFLLTSFTVILATAAFSQQLTKEDSLAAGLMASKSATVLSGYGSMQYSNNITTKQASTNIDRMVLFIGHKFNSKISFFSEIEIEDVKIAGGSPGGELALEQAFIKFDFNRNHYITTGLIIPRIGIINENHLPNTFNGNFRPKVEKFIIPATWRELGVSYYGTSTRVPGLNYSLSVLNGLNSANFDAVKGIREGRFEGADANANVLAASGALLYYVNHFRIQLSAYIGGSNTMSDHYSDSLHVSQGVFGAPVQLIEGNIQYKNKGLQIKALGTLTNIKDADKINALYGNGVSKQMYGYYGEIGYNFNHKKEKAFIVFSRYENLRMSTSTYSATNLQFITSGITYLPHQGVAVKLDHTYQVAGETATEHMFNLGVAYSY